MDIVFTTELYMIFNWNENKCLLGNKAYTKVKQADEKHMFCVGTPLLGDRVHGRRKSHPLIVQCMNSRYINKVAIIWEHNVVICR